MRDLLRTAGQWIWTGILLLAAGVSGCISTQQLQWDRTASFAEAVARRDLPFPVPPASKLDSVRVNDTTRTVIVTLSKEFAGQPFRTETVDRIMAGVHTHFGDAYPGYRFEVRTLRTPIQELVPNYYRRAPIKIDTARIPKARIPAADPVVVNTSRPVYPSRGLENKNVLLWHSHGWYYNNAERRWEWQRPRLFQSVEDLGPLSYTLPYLIPMLENAGARVHLPRERDVQTHEVILDNDTAVAGYVELAHDRRNGWTTDAPGFRPAPSYPANVNPFLLGSSRWTITDLQGRNEIRWTPDIPETGSYSVSIAYPSTDSSTQDARYTVHHTGGQTSFRVNQRVGGSTWHYLGTFVFRKGSSPDSGSLRLTSASSIPGLRISADAVRFGGGMGIVERGGSVSERPRFVEGARYYLQFAGMPDTLVYNLNGDTNDYKDDYQSRAEFGNYLAGAPRGPNKNREIKGLGIPIDVSLAFHTDAGISRNDTTIGTLLIYSVEGYDSALVFPDGVSRLANRDFADIMQTQIVEDIRLLHDPAWQRRDLRNADYSEAVRPNFPGVLLELLSHQNFLDMRFMLDPQFRFDVARAIYKSMLRFLSVPNRPDYTVQPLPITGFAAEFASSGEVRLRWNPTVDPLEPTAAPDRYIVYTRVENGGFDNGRLFESTECLLPPPPPGVITSYYVSAVNDGGQSMPSEVLSVCRMPGDSSPVLIVNGFDRISAPAIVESPAFSGFMNVTDAGVPDRIDFNFTGIQHDFLPASPFRSNDSPGFGASFADDETRLVAGNTFDYPAVHGAALRGLGRSFVSCSDEAIMDSTVILGEYRVVDLILGEERATRHVRPELDSLHGVRFVAFPEEMRRVLNGFTANGGRLLVSGSHIGSDLWSTLPADSSGMRFAVETLKCTWVTGHASRTGRVLASDTSILPAGTTIQFSTSVNDSIYAVESPEALRPVQGGKTLLRYAENSFSAGIGYKGTSNIVVLGFPFETILGASQRQALMRGILRYLE
ncbi:MAG: xanthan lyase [Bacteroidetes bacterium]|nr:xanthan lyase [Bacteroidota bacterium]